MHKFTKALAAIGLAAVMSQSAMAENLKLGFLVKQPEEPWFQTEWKFADKAGKDLGFEVIKIAVPDGEKTLNAFLVLYHKAHQSYQRFYLCFLADLFLEFLFLLKVLVFAIDIVCNGQYIFRVQDY